MTSEWAGPLYGFKLLTPERLDGDLWLRSSIQWPQARLLAPLSLIWPKPPDSLAAECQLDLQYVLPHGVPALACSCGIYAALRPLPWDGGKVPVLVRGWGKVALHTEGWRAERARIEAALVFGGAWEAAAAEIVSGAYGVPELDWREALELVEPTRLYMELVEPTRLYILATGLTPGAAAPPDADGGSS